MPLNHFNKPNFQNYVPKSRQTMKFKNIDPRRLESIHPKRMNAKRKFRGNYFLNKRRKSIGDDIDGGDIDGGDIGFWGRHLILSKYKRTHAPTPCLSNHVFTSERNKRTQRSRIPSYGNKNEGRTSFEQFCGIDRGKSDL